MKRKASAVWQGGLKDGKGTISADIETPHGVARSDFYRCMSLAGGLRRAFNLECVKPLGLVGAGFDCCSAQPNRIDFEV